MKLIIDIPDISYKWVKNIVNRPSVPNYDEIYEAVGKGIPIVQCKDCEFWEQQEKSLQGRCCLLQSYPTGGWFCGNAKKKENEE